MLRPLSTVCSIALLAASVSAFQPTLDRRAIEEAIYVGQSRIDADRLKFHRPYRVQIARGPVDWIDVITPFHRVELAAEMNARAGGRQFSQRQALEVLNDAAGSVDFVVEMSFHPLNTYVGMPIYQLGLIDSRGMRVEPRQVGRYPRFGPRAESSMPALPNPDAVSVLGTGQPILGGTMIAAFEGSLLDPKGRYEAVLSEGKTELVRARVDLAGMR